MTQLYTVGYQGQTINQFLVKMMDNKIDILIDIRENPMSRKPGFSKKTLKAQLELHGIDYLHYDELGTPKPLRNFLYETKNYDHFFALYKDYAKEYRDSVYDLIDLSKKKSICILCFEKDHRFCHRKVIADLLEEKFGQHVSMIHI